MKKIDFSVTTGMVAEATNIAWHTAQMHLMRLKDEGKVRFFRIGRQNQWILTKRIEKMKL